MIGSQFPESKAHLIIQYAQAKRAGYLAFREGKKKEENPYTGALALHWLAGFYSGDN
jgi:hypothetical protein